MLFTILFFVLEGLIYHLLNQIGAMQADMAATVVILLTSVVFMIGIGNAKTIHGGQEYRIIVIAYICRLLVFFWDVNYRYIFHLPNMGYDADYYHAMAANMAAGGGGAERGGNYAVFLSLIYRLFGANNLIGRYSNILLGMAVIFVFLQILELLEIEGRRRYYALLIVSLFPSFITLNIDTLREIPIVFLLSAALLFFIKWFKSGGQAFFFLAVMLTLLASTFHSGAVAPVAAFVFAFVLYDRKANQIKLNKKTIGSSVIIFIIFAFVFTSYGDAFLSKFGGFKVGDSLLDSAAAAAGGSGYSVNIRTGNGTLDTVINAPVRMVYFMLSPLPWDWRGLSDIIAFCFSGLFYLITYITAIRALAKKDHPYYTLVVVLFIMALASAFIFAWGVSNAGTALRHRDKFFVQYVLLFILSFSFKDKGSLSREGDA